MSDMRDADLVRLFATAERPLPDSVFVAELRERLAASRCRSAVLRVCSTIALILRGAYGGITAPFRVGWQRIGLATIAATAAVAWLVLEES